MQHAYRLIKISRPRFWIYLLGPYLLALAAAGKAPDVVTVLFGLYLTLPANLLIYGVNDLSDTDTDRLNPKKGSYEALLAANERRWLKRWMLALNAPLVLLLPFLPVPALIWIAVFLICGVGYSLSPLRFKTKPGLDAVSNVLYAAPGFAAYAALTGQYPALATVIAATCWCAAMHAFSAVPDIDADRKSQTPTIATTLGARATLVLCILSWSAAAALVSASIGMVAAVSLGSIYIVIGIIALRASSERGRLFKVYAAFPLVNSIAGFVLFVLFAAKAFG